MANAARNLAPIGMVAMAAMVTLAYARPVMASSDAPQSIVVSMANHSQISGRDLAAAQAMATRIYKTIDVSLLWVDAGAGAPPASGSRRLQAQILSKEGTEKFIADQEVRATVLAVAPHDTDRVYIFSRRVTAFASSKHVSMAKILGRVIAHELGHHLLPNQGHSIGGLMRAVLDPRMENLQFTSLQAREIHARLAAR